MPIKTMPYINVKNKVKRVKVIASRLAKTANEAISTYLIKSHYTNL